MAANGVTSVLNKCPSCATSEDKPEEQEKAKSALCVPKITVSTLEDVYLLPRRTKEMLESPLHSNLRSASFMRSETEQLQPDPRRLKELLQSPLHRDSKVGSKNITASMKSPMHRKVLTTPSNDSIQPRRIKELFKSPLHKGTKQSAIDPRTRNIYSDPLRFEDLLRSPIHKDLHGKGSQTNYLKPCNSKQVIQSPKQEELTESMVQDLYMQPRRIKELLQSPLHKDMRLQIQKESKQSHTKLLPSVEKKENVKTPAAHSIKSISNYSEPRRIKEPKSNCSKQLFKSPQQPVKKPQVKEPNCKDNRVSMHAEESKTNYSEQLFKSPLQSANKQEKIIEPNCYSEPRRIKELLQSPLHKDMRATMMPRRATNNHMYSEPRHTKDLLYAQCSENQIVPVRRKLQFQRQETDSRLQRILCYLENVFKSIEKRDLQQLGVQNFIIIMQHLLPLTGIAVEPLSQANYVEQTLVALKHLQYPHNITRSALLMPSASLTQVLQLLDFLIELVAKKHKVLEDKQMIVANIEQLELHLQSLQLEMKTDSKAMDEGN